MADEQNKVTLIIDGEKYAYWTSVSIVCELTSITRTFSVNLTRGITGTCVNFPVKPGSEVEVLIGSDRVLSGYVTGIKESYSASSISYSVKGSSYPIDLVDCMPPVGSSMSFKKQTPKQILEALCSSYAIGVVDHVGINDRFDFDISPINTIKKSIDDFLKKHSLLLTDDADGNLVVTKPGFAGEAHDALSFGENILSGEIERKASKLFSSYVVYGQQANAKGELPVTENQLVASAERTDIRPRVLAMKSSGSPTRSDLQRRAMLLRDYEDANAIAITYVVHGWRQSDGSLWIPNLQVDIKDPAVDSTAKKIISSVTYKLDAGGMITTIKLVDKNAFIVTSESDSESVKKAAAEKAFGFKKKGKTENADWTTA